MLQSQLLVSKRNRSSCVGDAQAAALTCPRRDFPRKILLFFAALQFGPTQCVTFWLSHNAKKVSFVSQAKLPCGKFLYRSTKDNNFSAEFLHWSIVFLATIFLLKFCRVRCCFIKCRRFFFPPRNFLGFLFNSKILWGRSICPFVLIACECVMKPRCHQLS